MLGPCSEGTCPLTACLRRLGTSVVPDPDASWCVGVCIWSLACVVSESSLPVPIQLQNTAFYLAWPAQKLVTASSSRSPFTKHNSLPDNQDQLERCILEQTHVTICNIHSWMFFILLDSLTWRWSRARILPSARKKSQCVTNLTRLPPCVCKSQRANKRLPNSLVRSVFYSAPRASLACGARRNG